MSKSKHNHHYYRKIYKKYNGPIPVEPNGRTYEIHHIDGNHTNNDPVNLTAITLQEHYNIHYNQGDYGACYLMAIQRMSKTPEEISDLARKIALKRVTNGTNPVCVSSNEARIRALNSVKKGIHPWLGGKVQSNSNRNRAKNGTHPNTDGKLNLKRLDEGTHPSQIKVSCIKCHTTCSSPNFVRHHRDNCKKSINL